MFEAAILGTILAATDAALGKAVITNKAVPARIREGLNIESGLNDGLCVPILFVFVALALGSATEGGTSTLALKLVIQELGIGLVVGLGLAAIGTRLLRWCLNQGWVTEIWKQVTALWRSPLLASRLHRAYTAVGTLLHSPAACSSASRQRNLLTRLVLAAEGAGETLALMTWLFFGVYRHWSIRTVFYLGNAGVCSSEPHRDPYAPDFSCPWQALARAQHQNYFLAGSAPEAWPALSSQLLSLTRVCPKVNLLQW